MPQLRVAEGDSICVSARCKLYSTNLLVCCSFKALLFLTVSSRNMNFKRVVCCVMLCCVMLYCCGRVKIILCHIIIMRRNYAAVYWANSTIMHGFSRSFYWWSYLPYPREHPQTPCNDVEAGQFICCYWTPEYQSQGECLIWTDIQLSDFAFLCWAYWEIIWYTKLKVMGLFAAWWNCTLLHWDCEQLTRQVSILLGRYTVDLFQNPTGFTKWLAEYLISCTLCPEKPNFAVIYSVQILHHWLPMSGNYATSMFHDYSL